MDNKLNMPFHMVSYVLNAKWYDIEYMVSYALNAKWYDIE